MAFEQKGTDIRAVLFDIDDTLFDRIAAQTIILQHIVNDYPHLFTDLKWETIVTAFYESDRLIELDFEAGAPSDNLRHDRSRLFLDLLGLSPDHAGAITKKYVNDYPLLNAAVPGTAELITALTGKYSLGVISNGLPDVQYRKLETLGILGRFSCIVLSEELGIRKPDPAIFIHAASALESEPYQCLYVGNSYQTDVIGAKSAGMTACWLDRGMMPPENTEVHPDIVVTELFELASILGVAV